MAVLLTPKPTFRSIAFIRERSFAADLEGAENLRNLSLATDERRNGREGRTERIQVVNEQVFSTLRQTA